MNVFPFGLLAIGRLSGAAALVAVAGSAPWQQKNAEVVPPVSAPDVQFRKIVVNAQSDFEAANAADVDGDGKLDIVSGDTWYKAPNWEPRKFRDISVWGRGPGSSGYRGSFAELPLDVNGDKRIDVVSSDYASGEVFWHENPGPGSTSTWTRHLIATPGSAETSVFAPLSGRNKKDILPNVGSKVVWYELRQAGPKPQWVEHVVGAHGAGHGIGFGDIDKDGKTDLITPTGWWRNEDAVNDKWEWRPEFRCQPADLGISTPVHDWDGDGDQDIVFGSGHNYGLYWLRNDGAGKWAQLPIDLSESQYHALILTIIAGRGEPVVVTGKRYLAHDHDPGAEEPLSLTIYAYDRKAKGWRKQPIDRGSAVGTGLQLNAVDMNGDGRMDILAPGKSGLYLFVSTGARR